MKVTLVFEDNKLAGERNQPDFTIFVSGEPAIDWQQGMPLPDPETLSPALLAAVECLGHISGLTAETAFVRIATGSEN